MLRADRASAVLPTRRKVCATPLPEDPSASSSSSPPPSSSPVPPLASLPPPPMVSSTWARASHPSPNSSRHEDASLSRLTMADAWASTRFSPASSAETKCVASSNTASSGERTNVPCMLVLRSLIHFLIPAFLWIRRSFPFPTRVPLFSCSFGLSAPSSYSSSLESEADRGLPTAAAPKLPPLFAFLNSASPPPRNTRRHSVSISSGLRTTRRRNISR
mmetsp:Transcript_19525/g.41796  ORF Transcript_19525/g.41796 Transcript_19525/m.41796 type:complete len:218 (+) Transcript_19525:535-1188(+)